MRPGETLPTHAPMQRYTRGDCAHKTTKRSVTTGMPRPLARTWPLGSRRASSEARARPAARSGRWRSPKIPCRAACAACHRRPPPPSPEAAEQCRQPSTKSPQLPRTRPCRAARDWQGGRAGGWVGWVEAHHSAASKTVKRKSSSGSETRAKLASRSNATKS